MRIIAGELKGRVFDAPKGRRTHPMSEKARGGLFSALGDIEGLTVLDAFSGSGALAYETISRGAGNVVALDIDKNAHVAIKKNLQKLGINNQVKAIRANASGWSDNNPAARFDLVFACPPYDDLQEKLLAKLTKHLKPAGIYVLDWPGKSAVPELQNLEKIKSKSYGDAQLVFYRQKTYY